MYHTSQSASPSLVDAYSIEIHEGASDAEMLANEVWYRKNLKFLCHDTEESRYVRTVFSIEKGTFTHNNYQTITLILLMLFKMILPIIKCNNNTYYL